MGQCGKATAFGIGEPQPFMAELSFEDAVFLNHIRDHLLLVTLNPSSEHREQDMREHGLTSGWQQCRYCTVKYTSNLSAFNGVETIDFSTLRGLIPLKQHGWYVACIYLP
jgi:hypothetical protein